MTDETEQDILGQEAEQRDDPQPQQQQQPSNAIVPNVRLAPSAQDKALSEGLLVIGHHTFDIPDEEGQMAGFDAGDKAGILVAQFSQFKFIHEKGQVLTQNVQF